MRRDRLALVGGFVSTLAIASGVHAQDAQAGAGVTSGTQEIIVTAQRREQSVLDVPLSIQASTGEQLAETGIKDLTNLQFTTPGYLPNTSSGFTQIFIRGVGNTLFVGADPSVATFIDDVPHIYGTTADDLVDVQRIEVLKGAQGGLYGRNATGGVVNIITRKPDLEAIHAEARVSYGEKNTFRGTAYLNVPLAPWAAFNASVERISHDPYVQNVAARNPYTAAMFPNGWSPQAGTTLTPQQTASFFNAAVVPPALNDENFWATRAKLLLQPTNNFSIVLEGDYYDKKDNNGQGQIGTTPGYTQDVLTGYFQALGIATNLPAGFIYTPSGKFQAANGAPSIVKNREYGLSATMDLDIGAFKLTSISAYRNQRTYFLGDSGLVNVPTAIAEVSYPYKRNFYQELRAVSHFDGPLQILGGATYLESQLKGSTQVYFMSTAVPLALTAIQQTVKNWSVYAQASYDFTDKLTLTASGRYMHETNDALFTQPIVSSSKTANQKFVPSATLSYKIQDGTIYARWARGFKTGGVNLIAAPAFFPRPQDGSVFGPETVDTFEAGYHQALFDRRVQVTATVFYNDYKNLQVSARAQNPAIAAAVVNANSARTWGVEGTLNWRVVNPLTLSVNAGYLNAKYKDYRYSGSSVIADFDLSGKTMTNSPELQLSFNAALDQPLNDRLHLTGNVLVSHTSGIVYMYSAFPANPALPDATVPGYWLVNARIGIKTADEKLGFAVVADNLFNRAYYTSGVSTAVGDILTWGDRRVIRGEVTVKF